MADPKTGADDGALNTDDLDTVAGGTFNADIHPGIGIGGGSSSEMTTPPHEVAMSVACLNPQPLPP